MNHAGEILILTGPPGSGKTATAQALARAPGSSKVHLHSDDFWHFVKNGAIQPYLPKAHDQNTVVVDVLSRAAEGYARGGYDVAIQRCQERGGDTLTDPDPIMELHKQLSSLGQLERHALPIDALTREETLAAVIAAVGSGAYRLAK
jgi:DNA polymerase III delta prime subunit